MTTLVPAIHRLALNAIEALRKVPQTFQQPYRPERHYMRGPGPMWRAKHELAHESARVSSAKSDADFRIGR
jgi:hypothetical protein